MPRPERSHLPRYRWTIIAIEAALSLVCLAFIVALAFVAALVYRVDIFTGGLYLIGSAALLAESVKRIRNLYESDAGGDRGQS